MFEEKKKSGLNFKGPKSTTFGNDSDDESEVLEEIPSVEDFMKNMDSEIKNAKQQEKNASIAKVYSSQTQAKETKSINGCGCF